MRVPLESVVLSPAVAAPSAAVLAVVDAVALTQPELARTVDSKGGITVEALRGVLEPVVEQVGFDECSHATFSAKELLWEHAGLRVAISVQAGRAETNNGALMAVLAAAAQPSVDWLVVVLPDRYKGGSTFGKVRDRVRALKDATGVRLDLAGVTLIGF